MDVDPPFYPPLWPLFVVYGVILVIFVGALATLILMLQGELPSFFPTTPKLKH